MLSECILVNGAEDREKRTERFTWLKTKIFLLMVGTLIVAVIVLYMLYEHVIFGNFGNLVVGFLQEKFFLDFMDARTIYQYTFREHWGLVLSAPPFLRQFLHTLPSVPGACPALHQEDFLHGFIFLLH